MRKNMNPSRLAFLVTALFLSVVSWTLADELRVGVYGGLGQEGIIEGLSSAEGIRAEALRDFSPGPLSRCDVAVWAHGRLALTAPPGVYGDNRLGLRLLEGAE